jgi:hypothetical protein
MDSRGTIAVTSSLRQQNRQILGSFLLSLEDLDPWWVSVVSPVNGDDTTTLTHLLGFEHLVGLQFMVSTGLLKCGLNNSQSFSAMQAEWDKFIIEQSLQDIMETVNQTSVVRVKYYFINYGKKKGRIIVQWNNLIQRVH